jgi:hypothetical protein
MRQIGIGIAATFAPMFCGGLVSQAVVERVVADETCILARIWSPAAVVMALLIFLAAADQASTPTRALDGAAFGLAALVVTSAGALLAISGRAGRSPLPTGRFLKSSMREIPTWSSRQR